MKIFIAAPFGNYLSDPNAISVTGTWTLKHRAGTWKRLWRIASTLRYDFKLKGWVNNLGLPNEGIEIGLKKTSSDQVLSIAGIERNDWVELESLIPENQSLELNLSCPNITERTVWNDLPIFFLGNKREWCIAKVSPMITPEQLAFLIEEVGFTQLHLCNTLPVLRGGLSGEVLRSYVLNHLEFIRNEWGNGLELIAGGGVDSFGAASDYLAAGANHLSLGSVCFNPLKVKKLIRKLVSEK
tara:strand:+ start:904 stop:1626 length:723 start_codon:yes stop_codon:yes gene_type:complete